MELRGSHFSLCNENFDRKDYSGASIESISDMRVGENFS